MTAAPAPEKPARVTVDEVRRVTDFLQRIVADRTLMNDLGDEVRKPLLEAASRLVNPKRDELSRLHKRNRREKREAKRDHDRSVRAETEIRALRREPVFTAPQLMLPKPPDAGPERLLENPRNCYVCKSEFRKVHYFYDSMCWECAEFNYAKRFQRAPLNGKVALITGARVKIGYQASLMLLRSGARVIATTRFPQDSALRYAKEPDFSSWSHRLHIHGLDLRHAPSVELFAKHLELTQHRLDILINNAAQTVRRPPGWYAHLLAGEQKPISALPPEVRPLLQHHQEFVASLGHEGIEDRASTGLSANGDDWTGSAQTAPGALLPSWRSADPALGIHSSALLSLVPYALEQDTDDHLVFPEGKLDADLQQVDLRDTNSWRLKLAEVATAEMLEVHLVNAVAPFILVGKLKGLMLRDRSEPGHVVNVSAMEGIFSRGTKTDKHPHTNMAKAALNMMTLTSAPDYAKDRIYMNAADTGWVTDEDPAVHATRKVEELDFQPPLDIVDGAARIVDPVFNAINTGEFVWGNFFKDYRPAPW